MSRLKKNESITRIMTKGLQTIHLHTSLSTVGKIFSESNFHHLPVVSGSKLIGIVSFVDLMRVNFADSFGVTQNQSVYEVLDRTLSVEAIMTKTPTVLNASQHIQDAAEILAESEFHALPIVDDSGDLGWDDYVRRSSQISRSTVLIMDGRIHMYCPICKATKPHKVVTGERQSVVRCSECDNILHSRPTDDNDDSSSSQE